MTYLDGPGATEIGAETVPPPRQTVETPESGTAKGWSTTAPESSPVRLARTLLGRVRAFTGGEAMRDDAAAASSQYSGGGASG